MGSPSKTQIEAWTDRISAIIQAELTGRKAEFTPATLTTLWDQVDASGDPVVENALATYALAIDAAGLPENQSVALANIFKRAELTDFVNALHRLVTSAAGGGYASVRAYLVDKSAKLHPLFGELAMNVLGSTAFTSSSVVAGISNPTYSAIFPDRVYVGADGSLSDETTDALDVGTADITLFGSDDHTLYIGCERKFEGIVVALSTVASATIEPTFQYWNGSSWATLTCTDNTGGFVENELISFTAPSDWVRYHKDSGGTAFADLARLYYIRIARTANSLVTPPVGTCITLIPTYAPSSSGATTHLGIQQPPLGVIRVTGTNTVVVTAPAAIDYTRFAHPLSSESKIRIRALTPLSASITTTLAYVNSSGADASQAQSAFSTPAALDTQTVSLASGSDGIRSVKTTTSATTSATMGVLAVEVLPIRTPAI